MSASSGFVERWLPTTLASVIHGQFFKDHFENPHKQGDYSTAIKGFLQVLYDRGIKNEIEELFNKAVAQVDKDKKYEVKNFVDFLGKVDQIVRGPPKFYKATAGEQASEPIGVPIHNILDPIINTPAGYTLLSRKDFNVALRVLLYQWGLYLADDPTSNSTLNDGEHGWFSVAGFAFLESKLGKLSFWETYEEDPRLTGENRPFPYYKTWDSFFTRAFKPGVRKSVDQKSNPFYLYNPCESTVFRTAADVRLRDMFWLKGRKYSLYDMLGGDAHPELSDYAQKLEGGSVLQSFLFPYDYHRWHSPVKGTVLASKVIQGTYFFALPDEAPEFDPDFLPGNSHGDISPDPNRQLWNYAAATRAVFIIEPGDRESNSPIDLIAFVAIGIVEVSSCEITYNKRQRNNPECIDVGDQLGTFRYGGSAFALIVKTKDDHKLVFKDIHDCPVELGQHHLINSVIGEIF